MKKIIITLIVLTAVLASNAQTYGGEIKGKKNDGVITNVKASAQNELRTKDSVAAALLAQLVSSGIAINGGTIKYVRGTPTTLTVTNLNSLANSQTAGWQSARIDNTSTLATDYLINVKLDMANTSPANDKAVYVYICPFYYDGSTWYASSAGTATLPSGSEGTYTINASGTNLKLLGVLNYQAADIVLQDTWLLSNAFGANMPDGFSIIIINYTGAAIAGSGNIVQYTALNKKIQ